MKKRSDSVPWPSIDVIPVADSIAKWLDVNDDLHVRFGEDGRVFVFRCVTSCRVFTVGDLKRLVDDGSLKYVEVR